MIPAGFGIVRVSRRPWEQYLKRRQKMVPRLVLTGVFANRELSGPRWSSTL
jgi:hypothetical protein